MNVLVISSLYPSVNDPVSGVFVQAQIQELVKGGCQVKVLSPVPMAPFPINLFSKKWAGFHATPVCAVVENIEVYYPRYLSLPRNWLFGRSGQRMYAGMNTLLYEISNEFQFDLIHAHVALPDGFAAMMAAERFQKPFLVTIHGADLQKTIHFNPSCKDIIGGVISHSSATILVSNKLKRIAETNFGILNKLKVIPNGIDPASLDLISGGASQKTNEEKIVLSVSNLVPSKGVDFNLYALERLVSKHPEVKYLVIGAGPERGHLHSLARKLGLSNRVEFLGKLPHDQVLSYMARCDIFSLPSWQEGFGIVYLEAMAHGKPVIGCQGEGIEDFVEDSETGYLVKPGDLDGLVKTLGDLLDHPEKRTETGKRAQKLVLENYTWEKNAQETIRLYQEIYRDFYGVMP